MLEPSLMAKLWKSLIEMYGHKFTSAYGEVPNETWAAALSGFGWQELAVGVRGCFHREDSWPPTLPEFVELCRPHVVEPVKEYVSTVKLLPKPESERKVVHEFFSELKKTFLR